MKDAAIGANCIIGEHCFIESRVVVGNNVTLKNGNMLWEGVAIEDGVFVGPNVFFSNDRHPRSHTLPQARKRYSNRGWLLPTLVKHGASIGAGAIISPGVTIGEFSLISPGTIVTRDVPAYAMVGGNPARRRGWVCQCGRPLHFLGRRAHCTDCDLDYRRNGNQVELCAKVARPGKPTPAPALYRAV